MRILQRGDTGSDVRTAQTALIRAGYDPGAANGVFGAATERAVMQFQRVLGATQDGIIGPVTWQFLEPFQRSAMLAQTGVADRATWLAIAPYIDYGDVYLRRGDRGMLVTILQTALTSAGFSPGQADGIFGSRTFNAVTAFQRANRITADGIAGPRTWALLKPYLSGELMTYVVRRGDTLSSIARRFNTTVEELLRLNPREDPDLIFVGETLLIPVSKG